MYVNRWPIEAHTQSPAVHTVSVRMLDYNWLISCFIPKGTYPITLGKGYNNIKIIQIAVYIMTEELAKKINVKLIIWNIDFL